MKVPSLQTQCDKKIRKLGENGELHQHSFSFGTISGLRSSMPVRDSPGSQDSMIFVGVNCVRNKADQHG
jgi:hypothetical protein